MTYYYVVDCWMDDKDYAMKLIAGYGNIRKAEAEDARDGEIPVKLTPYAVHQLGLLGFTLKEEKPSRNFLKFRDHLDTGDVLQIQILTIVKEIAKGNFVPGVEEELAALLETLKIHQFIAGTFFTKLYTEES